MLFLAFSSHAFNRFLHMFSGMGAFEQSIEKMLARARLFALDLQASHDDIG